MLNSVCEFIFVEWNTDMKNPFSKASSAERLFEDELYARVYEEIENGQMDKAAQARAIEEGGGDDGTIKKAYIKHRIARIKAEIKEAKDELRKTQREHTAHSTKKTTSQKLKRAESFRQKEIDKLKYFETKKTVFRAISFWLLLAFVFTVLAPILMK